MQAKTFATGASAWRVCVVGLILVGLLAGAALADKAITKVGVVNKSDCVVITVQGNHALSMSILKAPKGNYLGFQFRCRLAAKGRLVGIRSGKIHSVRYSNFRAKPPVMRIVANTAGFLTYSTEWSKNNRQVAISVWKYGSKPSAQSITKSEPAAKAPEKPVVKVAGSLEVAKKPEPTVTPPVVAPTAVTPRVVASAAVAPAPVAPAAVAPPTVAPLAVATPPVATPAATRVAMNPPPAATTEKMVSLDFLDADINDVLKALSVQSGENIVAGKDVTGNVTVSLSDVGVDRALDYVAKLSGYDYVNEKGNYLVGTKESLRALMDQGGAGSKLEVVALTYPNGDDLVALLNSQYPTVKVTKSSMSTSADDASAAGTEGDVLVLNGSESTVGEAMQLIAQIEDSMRNRAAQETARVYEVKFVSPFELKTTIEALIPEVKVVVAPSDGFDLVAPEAIAVGGGSSAGGATIQHTEIKKDTDEIGWVQALVFYGSESAVTRAMLMADQFDVKPPQIKIEAKVTSLTEAGEKKLGLSWDWGVFGWLEGFTDFDKTTDTISDGTNKENVRVSHERFNRQPWSIAGTLDAIIQNGEGTLLASPTMICVEGKPGVFFVGDEVRYVTLVQVTPTGTNVTTETANVGVQLRVVGDVSPDGYITLNLHPEVSVLRLTWDEEAKINLPIITRRFTDHVIRVKSGETIVIGGLIRDDEFEEMKKVPILGDIPLLGSLFRHKHTTKDHSEVVMFISASIIED